APAGRAGRAVARRRSLGPRQDRGAAGARSRRGGSQARRRVVSVDVERFRTRLQMERRRVLSAIDNLHHESSMEDEVDESLLDNHLAETASVTIDREIDFSLEENETRVLAAIDAALARIDDGTFGRCERCGKPIEEDRLEAIPYATLCIDDKRLSERG